MGYAPAVHLNGLIADTVSVAALAAEWMPSLSAGLRHQRIYR